MNNPETKQAAELPHYTAMRLLEAKQMMRELILRHRESGTNIPTQDVDDIEIILDALAAMETELADRDSRLAAAEMELAKEKHLRALNDDLRESESRADGISDYMRIERVLFTEIQQQLAAAQRSAEDARRDSARLKFLIDNEACVLERLSDEEAGEEFEVYFESKLAPIAGAGSPLAAIDAAMSATAEGLTAKDRGVGGEVP